MALPAWSKYLRTFGIVSSAVMPAARNVRISSRVARPSAFASSQSRSCGQMASASVMAPSSLPPSCRASYCARPTKPLGALRPSSASGVPTPNNSAPLSTSPLPLRSSARKASSPPGRTHCTCSRAPSALTSKYTPTPAAPSLMPSLPRSMTMGLQKPQALPVCSATAANAAAQESLKFFMTTFLGMKENPLGYMMQPPPKLVPGFITPKEIVSDSSQLSPPIGMVDPPDPIGRRLVLAAPLCVYVQLTYVPPMTVSQPGNACMEGTTAGTVTVTA